MFRRSHCTALALLVAGLGTSAPATAAVLAEMTAQGLRIELSAAEGTMPRAGEPIELALTFQDAATGEPVAGLTPLTWLDRKKEAEVSCETRIGTFMQGHLTSRPEVDLNAWRVLTLNEDPSVTIVDPVTGLSRTKIEKLVPLGSPGYDWAPSSGGKQVFISLPGTGEVVVLDTRDWTVGKRIPVLGAGPLAVSSSGRLLWVGTTQGSTAIDLSSLEPAASFDLSGPAVPVVGGDRVLLVGAERSLLVDPATLSVETPIETGGANAVWSPLSRAFYVWDRNRAEIAVVTEDRAAITARVAGEPGTASMAVSQDGRWIALPNPRTDRVYILDTADNRIRHTVAAGEDPDQVAFSEEYAYVRALGSDRVTMLRLADLMDEDPVSLTEIPAGNRPPSDGLFQSAAAEAIAPASLPGMMLFANPADESVWMYMEGMNAPMGNFQTARRNPRAVLALDRGLREVEPGVHRAVVTLPRGGDYDLVLQIGSPAVTECLTFAAAPAASEIGRLEVEHLGSTSRVPVGKPVEIQFRLSGPGKAEAAEDVRVMAVLLPGTRQVLVPAQAQGDGRYKADLSLPQAGRWQILVEAPSLGGRFNNLPWRLLNAVFQENHADASPILP